jgi:hypothetical protein
MMNKSLFKHGIAAMVILVFALLALGSGASTPAVYNFDPSVAIEEQFRLNVLKDYSLVSIDEKKMKGSGSLNIPAGRHTIVFNYFDNKAYEDAYFLGSTKPVLQAEGLKITYDFEPSYEYNLDGIIGGNKITPRITKVGLAEWALPVD